MLPISRVSLLLCVALRDGAALQSPQLFVRSALDTRTSHAHRRGQATVMMAKVKGPPPIPSRQFKALASPDEYESLLEKASPNDISIIKFQAPWCRTCRAAAPLLDRKAKKYPNANFFSIDLVRDGKAAGERMNRFFQSRNATKMPYIEVYCGSSLIDTEVVPFNRIELFDQAIAMAVARLKALPTQLQRQMLSNLLQQQRADRAPAKARGDTAGEAPSPARGFASEWLASMGGGAERPSATSWQASSSSTRPPRLPATSNKKPRGAPPLRGATGGRRKGWR